VKKSSSLLILGLSLCSFSSCLSLGLDKLPETQQTWSVQACTGQTLSQTQSDLHWNLKYLGSSEALPTAHNLFGRITRYVYPFTEFTSLFELSIENQSRETLWLNPQNISLKHSDHQSTPLELHFFERAWPVGAVTNQAELIDRSMAIAKVYRTLLNERPVLPGETYTGIVAFHKFKTPPQAFEITAWQQGQTNKASTQFCLQSQAL